MRRTPATALLLAVLLPTLLGAQDLKSSPKQEHQLHPANQEELRRARPDLTTPEKLQVDRRAISTPKPGDGTSSGPQDKVTIKPSLQDATIERAAHLAQTNATAVASNVEESSGTFRVIDLPSSTNQESAIRKELRAGLAPSSPGTVVVGRLPIGPQPIEDLEPRDPGSSVDLHKAVDDVLRRLNFIPEGAVPMNDGGADQSLSQHPALQGGWKTFALPYQIVGSNKAGTALNLRPFVVVDAGGLRPATGGSFWGRIFTSVLDIDHPDESHAIGRKITFLITG